MYLYVNANLLLSYMYLGSHSTPESLWWVRIIGRVSLKTHNTPVDEQSP